MLAYLFLILAVAVHLTLLPHPWSFTPVVGALLFFGARGPRRQIWVPFALLAVSDLLLNKFVYSYPLSGDIFVTWAWYAAVLWLGTNLRENSKPLRVLGAALAGSVSFFLLSNFGVWALGTMYPHNWSGLMTSYIAGVPFFRPAIEGDLLFTSAMFVAPGVLYVLGIYGKHGDHAASA
jgi:hypothetical protein